MARVRDRVADLDNVYHNRHNMFPPGVSKRDYRCHSDCAAVERPGSAADGVMGRVWTGERKSRRKRVEVQGKITEMGWSPDGLARASRKGEMIAWKGC